MERKGYKRFMENIQNRGPNLKVVPMYISVYGLTRKNNFPHVQHQFDVWHVAKSITKKLTEKAKNKECSVLFPEIKAISNHL